MTNILITGANGYIGSHVVSKLCDMCPKDTIIAVDFKNDKIDKRAKFLNIDLLRNADSNDLYKQLGSPDICVHLAWQDGFNHQADSHLENLYSHFSFLRNLVDNGCKSISIMGTVHEIGYYEGEVTENTPCNPLSLYGIAKNALRQSIVNYCEGKNVSLKWLRAYYIMGDDKNNKSIFSKIMQMEIEGKSTFPLTTGVNKYDFIDIVDLSKQISAASIQNEISGIVNVCSGKPIALKDKVEDFIRVRNLNIIPEYGIFPIRKYDSPAIWGNVNSINKIMGK